MYYNTGEPIQMGDQVRVPDGIEDRTVISLSGYPKGIGVKPTSSAGRNTYDPEELVFVRQGLGRHRAV